MKLIFDEYVVYDLCIKIVYCIINGYISVVSNSVLVLVIGDFVGLLDYDDELYLFVFYYVVELIE